MTFYYNPNKNLDSLNNKQTEKLDSDSNKDANLGSMNINFYQNNNDLIRQDINSNTYKIDKNQVLQTQKENSTMNQYALDVNINTNAEYLTNSTESYNYSSVDKNKASISKTQSQQFQKNDDGSFKTDILNKVFIGNISYNTTDEDLKNYFSKYGNLIDYVIIKDSQTKKPRGFGFVKYSDTYMVDELMKNRPHYLNNRRLDIKRSTPRKDNIGKVETHANVEKLFVAGFGNDVTENDLREYFSNFGNILNINIKPPKEGTSSKCYGFITFDDYDPVDKIILLKDHRIKSYKLTVQKANQPSKDNQDQLKRRNNKRYPFVNTNTHRETTVSTSKCVNCKCHQTINLSAQSSPVQSSVQNQTQLTTNSNNLYGSYNMAQSNLSKENITALMTKILGQDYSLFNQNKTQGPIKTQKPKNLYSPY